MKLTIAVQLEMKKEEDGGRHEPFTEGYCPHLVISGTTEWLGVRASKCLAPVAPGQTAEVEFELMYHPELDYKGLKTGVNFSMVEGPKVVGNGRVVKGIEIK